MKNAYGETEVANRYDSARGLPPETKALWLDALTAFIPPREVGRILDLGCGTGRFTASLGDAFECPVVGVEPSTAMLAVAVARGEPNVEWKQGHAENIPLGNGAVDAVFMSQVFHHLSEPRAALEEIRRVLSPAGHLAVRNGTRENHGEIEWLKYFPEARELENARLPSRRELEAAVCAESFELVSRRTVRQLFASSFEEYYEKISRRGLSSLIGIGDDAFGAGLRRLRSLVESQPRDLAVYEPVDLFIFRRKAE